MKKIICLIERLGPGGAQRQLVGLSSMLVQQGYDVELWSWVKQDFFNQTLIDAGVKNRCFENARDKKKRIFLLRKEMLKARPDIVISYLDTPSMVACIAKATGGKFKLIVSERNITTKHTFRERIKFFLYRVANYVVPNSFSQQNFIKTHYLHLSHKVQTITNFVDTDMFKPMVFDKQDDVVKIIVVARIARQKNPLFFIDVIKAVVDRGHKIVVDWYGRPLDTTLHEQCVAMINQYQLQEIIRFKPDTEQIAAMYPQYDIFSLPSLHEGYPNVVCEAMSCGLPVVCSAVSDVPHIVEEGINGYLFSPQSIDNAVSSFEKMFSLSVEERITMGQKNREKMLLNNSQLKFVGEYLNLIESK